MKRFVIKLFIFSGIVFSIIASLLFFTPTTHAFKKSLFFSIIDKNNLLKNTPEPRIIFIGGSNLSFGLNSQAIKDSLKLNPINMGIHASLGLRFMINDVLPFVKANDIIVICPEYNQFLGTNADGGLEVISTLADVDSKLFPLLDAKQAKLQATYVPMYISSKMKRFIEEQRNGDFDDKVGVYDRKSFNQYGDTYMHWEMGKQNFSPMYIKGKYNYEIIDKLEQFKAGIEKKHAKLYFSFPSLQDSSYDKSIVTIKTIEKLLNEKKFTLLCNPERYRLESDYFFDAPYHLNKKGVDIRTQLMIEDLQQVIHKEYSEKRTINIQ